MKKLLFAENTEYNTFKKFLFALYQQFLNKHSYNEKVFKIRMNGILKYLVMCLKLFYWVYHFIK